MSAGVSSVTAAILLSLLALSGEGRSDPQRSPLGGAPATARGRLNPFAGDADAARAGRKLFERHCAGCHGAHASGGRRAPSLISSTLKAAPPGEIFWFLTNGDRARGMPSWSRLPGARRWQLVTFLEQLNARAAVDAGRSGVRQ
jgi:mono/diheme cytochrome c family protein